MCNIVILKPYVMIDKEQFWNMCYNNWHSFGLVTKIGDKIDVIRDCPASGEIDPQKIWDLLDRDQEFERILHVRHNTAGSTSLENTHPFDVFYSDTRHVVFAHNGTLYEYKSKKWVPKENHHMKGTYEDDDEGLSDTKNFADRIITPLLASMNTGEGTGHYDSPIVKQILSKFWPSANRGILISNDQPTFTLGDWKTLRNTKGEEFLSSNDDYFKEVKRGPEKERRDEAEKAIKEAARAANRNDVAKVMNKEAEVVPLKNFQFQKDTINKFSLSTSLKHILNDYGVWCRSEAINLGMATKAEWLDLYESKDDCVCLMDWIAADYYSLYHEMEDMTKKHETAKSMLNKMFGICEAQGIDIHALLANQQQAA